MNVRHTLKKALTNENDIFERNYTDVRKSNSVMLNGLLKAGSCSFFVLFLISYFETSYFAMKDAHFFMMMIPLMVLLIYKYNKSISELCLLYVSYSLLLAICIYTGAFLTSDTTSVITVIFLILAPVTILDKSWRILIMEISFMLISILFIVLYKDKILLVDECVNIVTASVVGFFLGRHLTRTQIDNFDLKRQSIIRENTDALTKVGSRTKLFADLASEQFALVSGLVMMDIDDFKVYNDGYGHQKGDQCLAQIGSLFVSLAKQHAIQFYRYGGEEFVGVFYEQDKNKVVDICRRINDEVYALKIPHENTTHQFVSISVGLAFKEDNEHYEKLIYDADNALYDAKHKGKNTFCVDNATGILI